MPEAAPETRVAPDELDETIVVTEIFASVQGESTYAGRPCVFVRTTGCNLRCSYCDTSYAFSDGRRMRLREVLGEVERHGLPLVEVTGGEPLLQRSSLILLRALCDRGYTVLLETNGALDISPVDVRVIRVVDLKTPSSGEAEQSHLENLARLRPADELKLVIGDRADYDWAKTIILRYELWRRCTVLMGPVFGALAPRELAAWILADKLPVRLQLQLHKLIWDADARGV